MANQNKGSDLEQPIKILAPLPGIGNHQWQTILIRSGYLSNTRSQYFDAIDLNSTTPFIQLLK